MRVLQRTLPFARKCRRYYNCSRCASSFHNDSGEDTKRKHRPRVVVAMSGGVDSSVAAYLLQQQQQQSNKNNLDVIGLHMSNWNALDEDTPDVSNNNTKNNQRNEASNSTTYCETSEKEYNDAKSVAKHLSIPLHRVSFASEYWCHVFEPFVESLSSSHDTNTTLEEELDCNQSLVQSEERDNSTNDSNMVMPNPDFGCNTHIKFGSMKDYAIDRLQADYVATGHYAQIWHRNYKSSTIPNYSSMNNDVNYFHDWMEETSQILEQTVMESIAGRPEEEWILNNNSSNNSPSSNHYPMLIAGADRSKDQTYFLSGVKSEAFQNVIFPLGHLAKSQSQQQQQQPSVRDIAHQANIPTASKRDSMGICFIGKRNFGNFVAQYMPEPTTPGDFVDVDTNQVVGKHEGSMHYTIGQGAKISGAPVKYFVCGKGRGSGKDDGSDYSNTVFVCNNTHHPALYTDELWVDFNSFNWIGLGGTESGSSNTGLDHIPRPLVEGKSIKLLARTRHLQPLASCTVSWRRVNSDNSTQSSSTNRGHLIVHFDKPMRAITPGQIVALYAGSDGLICLGGGPIKSKGTSFMDRGIDEISLTALHPSGHNDLSLQNL